MVAPDAEIKDARFGQDRLDRAELDVSSRMVAHAGRPDPRCSRRAGSTAMSLGGTPPRGRAARTIRTTASRTSSGAICAASTRVRVGQTRRSRRGQLPRHVDHGPRRSARRYVTHYMLDFGKSLGTMAAKDRDPTDRLRVSVRLEQHARWSRSASVRGRGDNHFAPTLTGVVPSVRRGRIRSRRVASHAAVCTVPGGRSVRHVLGHQDPGALHAPADPRRGRGGAVLGPRAVEYLTDTLVARQRATEAYWYARVNPLDRFAMNGDALCFETSRFRHIWRGRADPLRARELRLRRTATRQGARSARHRSVRPAPVR